MSDQAVLVAVTAFLAGFAVAPFLVLAWRRWRRRG
jgi:hypothetical protein